MSLAELITSGDEDALAGFRDAHIDKVRAYCAAACPPELADDACQAAFVDFLGRALGAGETDRALEQLLLMATRSAAAARFQIPDSAPPARPQQCAAVPELLAARANGELPDDHALLAHVRHCPRCRASAVQLERADTAFARALDWEDAETPTEDPGTHPENVPTPGDASPPPSPTVVRVRRGGLVGRAKKLRDQLGGD